MSLMNRLGNSKNPYQGELKKVLCVCSAGLLRSPTAAWVLSNPPFNFNTRACGYNDEYALVVLDEVLLHWADEVVVMDRKQETVVRDLFNYKGPVHVLDVPDNYGYRDPELVEVLTNVLSEVYPTEV